MSRAGSLVSALLITVALSQATVAARTDQNATETAQAEPESNGGDRPPGELQKGDRQWGLVAGVGIAHQIWGGVADQQFLALGGRYGRIVTNPKGRGFLKGNMELAVEVYPVYLMFQGPTTYGFSFTLLFRHYIAPRSRVKPFLSLGLGAVFSIDPIPAESSHVNFTTQAGLGIMWFGTPRLAYLLEYRIHHVSNSVLAEVNPGINSSYIQFGVSIFR